MNSAENPTPDSPTRARRSYLTPPRLLVCALLIQGSLWGYERIPWLRFDGDKGWPVLIALATLLLTLLILFLWFLDALLYRRKFTFTIRSLLLLAVSIAIMCSWLAVEIRAAKRQQLALAELCTSHNTFCEYQPASLGWPAYWPRKVLGKDFFLSVRRLYLGGEDVTDAVVENLKDLPELENVSIEGTQVTDTGLQCLDGLSHLRTLSVGWSPITDAGVEHLSRLACLRKLDINSIALSNAGLERLRSLTSLRELSLNGMKFDAGSVKRLQESLPNCDVWVSPL